MSNYFSDSKNMRPSKRKKEHHDLGGVVGSNEFVPPGAQARYQGNPSLIGSSAPNQQTQSYKNGSRVCSGRSHHSEGGTPDGSFGSGGGKRPLLKAAAKGIGMLRRGAQKISSNIGPDEKEAFGKVRGVYKDYVAKKNKVDSPSSATPLRGGGRAKRSGGGMLGSDPITWGPSAWADPNIMAKSQSFNGMPSSRQAALLSRGRRGAMTGNIPQGYATPDIPQRQPVALKRGGKVSHKSDLERGHHFLGALVEALPTVLGAASALHDSGILGKVMNSGFFGASPERQARAKQQAEQAQHGGYKSGGRTYRSRRK